MMESELLNLKQELEFMCPKVSILGSEKLHQSSLGRWEWGVAAGCEGQADGAWPFHPLPPEHLSLSRLLQGFHTAEIDLSRSK